MSEKDIRFSLRPISSLVSKNLKNYVYALCELDDHGNKSIFYVGRGKGSRCLQHVKRNDERADKIKELIKSNRFVIDILRHGLDAETAEIVEATCIDLVSQGELTNKIRGFGTAFGRTTLEEIRQLYQGRPVRIMKEHAGLAFNLTKTYRSSMSDIELLEATRGTWARVPRSENLKYAYATYNGIVKEVYEIRQWLPAGTQQYFYRSRQLGDERLKNRFEFLGVLAQQDIRDRYKGKLIELKRSYGTPFQRVGL
jgi:hypothetical protein